MDFQKCQSPSFTQKLQDSDNGVLLFWATPDIDFTPLSSIQIDNTHTNPRDRSCVMSGALLFSQAISISERHVSVSSLTGYISHGGGMMNMMLTWLLFAHVNSGLQWWGWGWGWSCFLCRLSARLLRKGVNYCRTKDFDVVEVIFLSLSLYPANICH